jgi:hypothetical protein
MTKRLHEATDGIYRDKRKHLRRHIVGDVLTVSNRLTVTTYRLRL